MMDDVLDYVTLADGWVAGVWHKKGSDVRLTARQAQYENVAQKPAQVDLVGSLDDPTVKSSDLPGKAKVTAKRGRK